MSTWATRLLNAAGNAFADVDATFKALRVSIRPAETLGWNSIGAQTGLITGLAANSAIFSFRNISANPILIRRVGVGFISTVAFTAAQRVDYGLMFQRAFTASDTGGTAIALTGNNTKVRTSLATLTSVDCRIAAAAALGAGTKVADANHLSQIGGWVGAAGQGITASLNNLFSHDTGDYPIVLAQNEGINILNLTLMGAAGVGIAHVNIELAEVLSY
jgi:hypothetical protein